MPRNHLPPRLVLGALLLAACQDSPSASAPPDPPTPGGPVGRPVNLVQIDCRGDRASESVTCGPTTGMNASGDLIVGGQGVYVQVNTSGVNYNSGTGQFTFNLTVQNLIQQPLGTVDGSLHPSGVRLFFHQGPTVLTGTGVIAVLPDGFATFTAAGQPYYQYNEILSNGETSPSKVWTLIMPPTVTTFDFRLYVSAPVQFPDGYVTIDGNLPGTYIGDLHPGSTLNPVIEARSVLGAVIPGATFNFSSDDPTCATFTAGVITGVRAGNCDLDAVASFGMSGYVNLTVTGAVRTWDGSASTDWSNGANWVGDLVPADVDSVLIPTGTPNSPLLVANTNIGGVEVADGAMLSLGAFNLNVTANVQTGATAGSGVLGTTGQLVLAGIGTLVGRVPGMQVTGSYELAGDLTATTTTQVDLGELGNGTSGIFAINVDSQ